MQVVQAARKMMDQKKRRKKRTAIPLANEQANE